MVAPRARGVTEKLDEYYVGVQGRGDACVRTRGWLSRGGERRSGEGICGCCRLRGKARKNEDEVWKRSALG